MNSESDGSASPDVRLAWILSMASAFEICPLLNCLTTCMAPWTAPVIVAQNTGCGGTGTQQYE